jgi:hypothetical protein
VNPSITGKLSLPQETTSLFGGWGLQIEKEGPQKKELNKISKLVVYLLVYTSEEFGSAKTSPVAWERSYLGPPWPGVGEGVVLGLHIDRAKSEKTRVGPGQPLTSTFNFILVL